MQISVLGMGNMGRAIACRLLDHDHQVTVWNRSPGKARDLVERGATEAPSAAVAAEEAEAVIVLVRDDDAVRDVIGDIAGAGDPVIVNCTTISPALTAELGRSHPRFVAAPILGAPQAVAGGSATYVVAGPPEAVGRLDPMWPALTTTVVPAGEAPERAAAVKVISNHLLLTGVVALSEAVGVAQAVGLGDDYTAQLLQSSALVAPGLKNRLQDVVDGEHEGWFAMPLGAKDLGLFVDLANAHGVEPELAAKARDRYQQAVDAGFEEDDIAGVVELLRSPNQTR